MKTRSLVNAAMMLAIYLVFFVLYNIGILPTVITILLPIPLIIYSFTSKKVSEVIWLLVGCFIGSYLIGSIFGLMTTLQYGVMGAIIGIGLIKQWPYWQRLLNGALAVMVGIPVATYVVMGMSVPTMIKEFMNEVFVMTDSMSGMLPEAAVQSMESLQETMTSLASTLMPTLLILIGLGIAFLSDKVAMMILKRMSFDVPKGNSVQKFQLGSKLAIALLISQFSLLFVSNHALSVILMNIFVFLNVLFMVQGIIVAMAFFKARNQKGIGIFMVVIAVISNLSMFISMIGIMDALFNYRERFAVKGS